MMKDLVQRFPQSDYAPLALYYAALYAETRNQNEEALLLLAQLRSNYKDSPLAYDALRHSGDLERKRNNIKEALAAYDFLLADKPDHPMRDRVAMARADCLVALAGQDKGRRAAAIDALENLVASTGLPVDARVEAGFKLGFLLQSGTAAEQANAEVTYWSLIAPLRDDPAYGAELGKQGEGRYWMGRCIFSLANLYEQENRLNEAQSLYRLVIERGLDEFTPMAKLRLQKPPNAPDTPASPAPSAAPVTPGV
jgi:tetratricopeptide (TPR) repeat protein